MWRTEVSREISYNTLRSLTPMATSYYVMIMQRTGAAALPHAFLTATAGIVLACAMTPAPATAAELSIKTAQVIPPGGTHSACIPVQASNFVAHVYGGKLHSFDFSLSDPSYVAVAASAGDTGIPFNLMTRRIDQTGALITHVDMPATAVGTGLPITVTLLSARGAPLPVCLTSVSTAVPGAVPHVYPAASGSSTRTSTPAASVTEEPEAQESKTESGQGSASVALPIISNIGTSIGQAIRGACATPTASQRTWLILLLAYLVVIGVTLWAEFPLSLPALRTPERAAGIIMVLLLFLLAFWYFSEACRTAAWMPLTAILIAALGVLAAFRNHPRVSRLLLPQEITSS